MHDMRCFKIDTILVYFKNRLKFEYGLMMSKMKRVDNLFPVHLLYVKVHSRHTGTS